LLDIRKSAILPKSHNAIEIKNIAEPVPLTKRKRFKRNIDYDDNYVLPEIEESMSDKKSEITDRSLNAEEKLLVEEDILVERIHEIIENEKWKKGYSRKSMMDKEKLE
jgi:hypothetical protein